MLLVALSKFYSEFSEKIFLMVSSFSPGPNMFGTTVILLCSSVKPRFRRAISFRCPSEQEGGMDEEAWQRPHGAI